MIIDALVCVGMAGFSIIDPNPELALPVRWLAILCPDKMIFVDQ
jgi:hypothetical protein